MRPDEQRQPEPRHPRRAHLVDGDDEIEAGEDRREPRDEGAQRREHHVAVRVGAAVRRVERPAGIDASRHGGRDGHDGADHVDVPAQQIDPWKREIPRADHHRHQEVAEDRGNGRNEKEEDHDHAVQGEHLVVGVRLHQVAFGRDELHADHDREEPAEEKHQRDRDQIEKRDALVVGGEQPRFPAVVRVEVVHRRFDRRLHRHGAHRSIPRFVAPSLARPFAPSRRPPPGAPSDRTYAISCINWSSDTIPLNVGMMFVKPATIFASG